jgi:hypothetical protein
MLTAKEIRYLIDTVRFTANDTGVGTGEQSRWVTRALAVHADVSEKLAAGTRTQNKELINKAWETVRSLTKQISKTQSWIDSQTGKGACTDNVVPIGLPAPVTQSETVYVGNACYFADRDGDVWEICTEDGDALCTIPFPCFASHLEKAIVWYFDTYKLGKRQGRVEAQSAMKSALGL